MDNLVYQIYYRINSTILHQITQILHQKKNLTPVSYTKFPKSYTSAKKYTSANNYTSAKKVQIITPVQTITPYMCGWVLQEQCNGVMLLNKIPDKVPAQKTKIQKIYASVTFKI